MNAGTGVNNRIQNLFTSGPEPDTPKCSGISPGSTNVSAIKKIKDTTVMMILFFFIMITSIVILLSLR